MASPLAEASSTTTPSPLCLAPDEHNKLLQATEGAPSPDEFHGAEHSQDADPTTQVENIVITSLGDSTNRRVTWKTIAGCWLVQFCTIGYSNAFGVYQDIYTRDFLLSKAPSDISWIGSFQLFMQYAPGIVVGYAFDAGYFRLMLVLGSFLEVFSLLMLSLARRDQYYQIFLAQAIGLGLGQGLLFIPSLAIIPRHFKRHSAFATGIAVTGASFGGIIWPIVLNQTSRTISFANAVRATAGLAGVMLCCANALIDPGRPQSPAPGPIVSSRGGMTTIMRDGAFLISIVAACFLALGLFFPCETLFVFLSVSERLIIIRDFYLQLYALDRGINSDLAFYTIAILNAGGIFGRSLPNFFADRIGGYNLIVPCLLATSTLLFSMLSVNTSVGVVVFGLLYGSRLKIFVGYLSTDLSLIPTIISQLSKGSTHPGFRMGFAFTNVGFCMLVGTPIEGALLHDTPHGGFIWARTTVFSGLMVISGALGMLLSQYLFVRSGRNRVCGQLV